MGGNETGEDVGRDGVGGGIRMGADEEGAVGVENPWLQLLEDPEMFNVRDSARNL